MRLIIAGDRRFRDYSLLCSIMSDMHNAGYFPTEIISGGAKGADKLGERWANEHHVLLRVFPAEWDKYHKAAGPIRNKQMADYAGEQGNGALLAFLAEGSKGTKDMAATARKTSGIVHVWVKDVVVPEEV